MEDKNSLRYGLQYPFVLAVEGLIGSGKSSIIKQCLAPLLTKRGWKVTIIDEPVKHWGEILCRFGKDTARWAYTFQTIAFHDRVQEILHTEESHKERLEHGESHQGHIFIMERSIISDTLFVLSLYEQGHLDKLEYDYYFKWWKMWSKLITTRPHLILYLNPDIDVIMSRVKQRNRKGEEGITREYQQLLQKYHDQGFLAPNVVLDCGNGIFEIPTISIANNSDFADNFEDVFFVDKVESKIFETIRGLQTL